MPRIPAKKAQKARAAVKKAQKARAAAKKSRNAKAVVKRTPEARTSVRRAKNPLAVAFGKKLARILAERGWTQADLVREIWGDTTVDGRGYEVLKHKDSMSRYMRGETLPKGVVLHKIASVLNMTVEELAPELAAQSAMDEANNPELQITAIGGKQDLSLLRVHKILPTDLAFRIGALVREAKEEEK